MSTTSDKIDIGPGDAVPIETAAGRRRSAGRQGPRLLGARLEPVQARPARRSLSVGFIFFLLFASFIARADHAHILGHGPNDIFADGVDPKSLAPVGPWTHHQHSAVSRAPAVTSRHTLLPLGADGALGRDLFLRLLYGAQTSLEVALLATIGSVGLGVLMGLARRLLPRLGRHGRLAPDRDRHGLPVPALHHRDPRRGRDTR